jgi:transposase
MTKKRPYSSMNVKDVDLDFWLKELAGVPVLWVGIDVGKEFLKVVLCWGAERFSRPWYMRYPDQLDLLIELLKKLKVDRELVVAIEPTGTYSDPLRWALTEAKLSVQRIESKASHDYAEVFDGVPSQHDGKDAAILAELARHGRGTLWPLELKDEKTSTLRNLVESADDQQRVLGIWTGRLEALLARHWPEATRVLDLDSITLLNALVEFGGPAGLAADPRAAEKLQDWGGHWLTPEKVQELLAGAKATAGVPTNATEKQRLQQYALQALQARRELNATERQLTKLAQADPLLKRMGEVVGLPTACVLFVLLGDPRNYGSMRAYLKAAGLNLAERSSGQYQGQLKISKRGSAMARKWLYMAALRLVRDTRAAAWFGRKKQRDGGRPGRGPARKGIGLVGLVALMRKLLGAVWHVTRKDEAFDIGRLFCQGGGQRAQRSSSGRREPELAGAGAPGRNGR